MNRNKKRAWSAGLTKVRRTETVELLTSIELPRAYRLGTRKRSKKRRQAMYEIIKISEKQEMGGFVGEVAYRKTI